MNDSILYAIWLRYYTKTTLDGYNYTDEYYSINSKRDMEILFEEFKKGDFYKNSK